MAETSANIPATGSHGTDRQLQTHYVDWASIFAGTTIAVVMAFLLVTFGTAIGLGVASPWSRSGPSAESVGLGAAIWFALVQIYTAGMGAYLASRLRPITGDTVDRGEIRFRDGANGLAVWALSILVTVILTVSVASGLLRTGAQVVGAAASTVGDTSSLLVDRSVDALVSGSGTGPSNAAPQTGAQPQTNIASGARADLSRVVSSILLQGELRQQDRAYLEQLVSRYAGVTPEEATRRVNATIDRGLAETKQAMDAARRAAASGAFWTTVAFLLAGLAAWWAASLGGEHRDRGTQVFASAT